MTLAAAPTVAAGDWTLQYRGKKPLSYQSASDQHGQTFSIHGLSGITWCGEDDYIAVMDNSNKLLALKVDLGADATIQNAQVVAGRSVAQARDFEGIAYTDPARHSVLLSEESLARQPAFYEYRLDTGELTQTIDLPLIFATQRRNFGIEAIARSPDGRQLWIANEESLAADGEQSTPDAGSIVRLQRLRLEGGAYVPAEQYAYRTEPIHVGRGNRPSRSGVADLAVLPDGSLLVLERSVGFGLPPFRTSIYQVDLAGATDISRPPLDTGVNGFTIGDDYQPVAKKRLLSTGAIGENVEGLCVGPQLPNGNYPLLGIVDDGGATDTLSGNTLVAFELSQGRRSDLSIPLIAAGAALAGVLIAVLWRLQRKNPCLAAPASGRLHAADPSD